ncbi:MAG: ABC transporter permease [Planctomycetes bacterium]|nr:ABC transporter permease [Planctomycetota bacterium]
MNLLRTAREMLEGTSYTLGIAGRTALALPQLWRRRRETTEQCYAASVKLIHVIVLVGAFAGMILSLQTGLALADFGQEGSIGSIVAAAMVREMGPFITAVILAAAVGSALAAELGTMKVSDEITALEVMSIDPVPFLVLPRVVALTIACPLLAIVANVVGIYGGSIVAESLLRVDPLAYRETVYDVLARPAELFPFPKDIYAGLFKATVYGFLIAVIGCSHGLRASNGALGVGEAARTAVRNSIILVLVMNFILTRVMYT